MHQRCEAINERKRLKISTLKHKNLFGECAYLAADAIYATNENRKFTTQKSIQTNFCRKGAGKDDKPTKQIKSLLNKERCTRLECDRRSGKFWQRKAREKGLFF